MVSKEVVVVNPLGLHIEPACKLSMTAMEFKSEITIKYKNKTLLAKSVLNVLAAGVACGESMTICCSGIDEDEALKVLCEAVRSGLGDKVKG